MKTRFIVLFVFTSLVIDAQTEGSSYSMFWLGYYNYTQLNPKWNINTDIQHRTKDNFEVQAQTLLRSAAVYKINKLVNVGIGGAHFRNYIKNDLTRGEWRPWQEFGLNLSYGKLRVGNRLRAEQRFNQITIGEELANDYRFNWRFRYKIDVEFPLVTAKEKRYTLSLSNEFFINSGRTIVNPFDQNRSFISFNYQLLKNVKLLFQYMYIVQYIQAKNDYDKVSVIRFIIHHTISNERTANK